MMTHVLLWLLGAIVAGALMVVWGVRGKRLNDHPVCRQCRFDLSGAAEGTVTCPECGAGLKRPGSTRIGQRRKRPLAIAVGAAAVVMPLAAIGMTGFAMLTGSDVRAYMPLGVLLWEAKYADAARSKAIASEVLSRYNAKRLDESQVAKVVERALEVQGDTSIAWDEKWEDLIETADGDGKVSDEQKTLYHRQSLVLDFKWRKRVKPGASLPVIAKVKEARIGSSSVLQSHAALRSASLNGSKLARAKSRMSLGFPFPVDVGAHVGWFMLNGSAQRAAWGGGMSSVGEAKLLLDVPATTAAGRGEIDVQLQAWTQPQSRMMNFSWTAVPGVEDDPKASVHSARFEVEISPAETVELVKPDEEMRDRMRTVLEPSQVTVWKQPAGFGGGQVNSAMMHFDIDRRPIDAAFDVIWVIDGREQSVGQLITGMSADLGVQTDSFGGGPSLRIVHGNVARFESGVVDIILRPNVEIALSTVDLTRIYGEEIVFKDVQVNSQDVGGVSLAVPAAPTQPARGIWGAIWSLFGR